jgi:dipeptidyl aminopeptidase/acylaminoacyl peptidase
LYYETDKPQKEIFDAQLKSKHRSIDKALPGRFNSIYSRSRSGDVAVIRSMSDREPGEFFIANLDKLSMSQLGRARPWFSENKLAPMQPIQFKARDGITLNGYLTLPLGKDPKNLPFVMLPHGGPWLRDSWVFDEEVQFLANRGYGVLQVNFRGSTGYGRKLFEAGLKQWGAAMQDDITDGVKWLVSEGYADSNRIAIYGGSYGGYAALSGLCFTPEIYRCGISLCGVSDIYTQFREPARNNRYLKLFFASAVGDLSKERPELMARSPLENTDKIVAPVLLAHGDKDPIVDVKQTIRMVRELKKRGKEVEFIRKENEFHGFQQETNRVEFYGAMEQFLAKHLGQGQ